MSGSWFDPWNEALETVASDFESRAGSDSRVRGDKSGMISYGAAAKIVRQAKREDPHAGDWTLPPGGCPNCARREADVADTVNGDRAIRAMLVAAVTLSNSTHTNNWIEKQMESLLALVDRKDPPG